MSDRRRILATLSFADTDAARRLLSALTELRNAIEELPPTAPVDLPSLDELELELETATLPRDAFFGDTEMVPISEATGRISRANHAPSPGFPAVIPGEQLNDAVIDYLRSGLAAGMTLPDVADHAL